MTLQQWLSSPENIYDELTIVDRNGEERTMWVDDDPKYQAKVLDVKRGCDICHAEVTIDWVQ